MKYKSKDISFLTTEMKISHLCFYGEHYYFASDMEITEAEIATDEEFAEAMASVTPVESTESAEPEPTQADRIEAKADYLLMTKEG